MQKQTLRLLGRKGLRVEWAVGPPPTNGPPARPRWLSCRAGASSGRRRRLTSTCPRELSSWGVTISPSERVAPRGGSSVGAGAWRRVSHEAGVALRRRA